MPGTYSSLTALTPVPCKIVADWYAPGGLVISLCVIDSCCQAAFVFAGPSASSSTELPPANSLNCADATRAAALRTINPCAGRIRAARHIGRKATRRNMRATPAGAAMSLPARQQSPAARRRIVRFERGVGVAFQRPEPACFPPISLCKKTIDEFSPPVFVRHLERLRASRCTWCFLRYAG